MCFNHCNKFTTESHGVIILNVAFSLIRGKNVFVFDPHWPMAQFLCYYMQGQFYYLHLGGQGSLKGGAVIEKKLSVVCSNVQFLT